jgi:hypothetical protein
VATEEIPRDEAEAALEARRELGRDYEPAVVDSFVDRLDNVIQQRIDEGIAKRESQQNAAAAGDYNRYQLEKVQSGQRLALIIVSIVFSVPLSAIAATLWRPEAIALVWTGIVLLNVIFGLGNRRRD